jgi:hypothetical protein
LLSAVRDSTWRAQPSCFGLAIDGAPMPPQLTVQSGNETHSFGVSNHPCARSDHSATGDVVSCAAYDAILLAFQSITTPIQAPGCKDYW